jgi:hypothetical protein
MTLNEKLSELYNINSGAVLIGIIGLLKKGYLHIEKQEGTWKVRPSSHETIDILNRGKHSYAVEISDNKPTKAFILTSSGRLDNEADDWWSSDNPEIVEGLGNLVIDKINKAYKFHFLS